MPHRAVLSAYQSAKRAPRSEHTEPHRNSAMSQVHSTVNESYSKDFRRTQPTAVVSAQHRRHTLPPSPLSRPLSISHRRRAFRRRAHFAARRRAGAMSPPVTTIRDRSQRTMTEWPSPAHSAAAARCRHGRHAAHFRVARRTPQRAQAALQQCLDTTHRVFGPHTPPLVAAHGAVSTSA